jgi:beta-lactam-binding protein with PASTA domain
MAKESKAGRRLINPFKGAYYYPEGLKIFDQLSPDVHEMKQTLIVPLEGDIDPEQIRVHLRGTNNGSYTMTAVKVDHDIITCFQPQTASIQVGETILHPVSKLKTDYTLHIPSNTLVEVDPIDVLRLPKEQEIVIEVRRWADVDKEGRLYLNVESLPAFVTDFRWIDSNAVYFEPNEIKKKVKASITVVPEGNSQSGALTLHAGVAESDTFSSKIMIFPIRVRKKIFGSGRDEHMGSVVALSLRADAPLELDRENAIDFVDPNRDEITVYDRIAIFYTPSRPFPKGFMWQIHSSTAQKTYGAIKNLEIDLKPYSYRPAKAGSPGQFAAIVELSKPGVYALRTCPVQITGGIFGTGSGQPTPIEDQCQVVGEFEVTKQELHYQGFILEPFPIRPLPEGAFVGKSEVALTKKIDKRDVILSLEARWNRRYRSNNKIKKISQRTFAKGKFNFPETLDPGSRVMGTARYNVEQPPDVEWLDRHAKTPYNLEMQHALAVKFSIGDLTAISAAPPERAMFSGPDAARPYGKWLAGGASPNRNMLEISRGWGRDNEIEISFERDHEERLTPFGIPAQPLARHLADEDTLFVIPVKIELYEDTRITSDDFVKIQIWGYAVYGSTPGRYAGPLPTSHDEIPEAVANRDATREKKPPREQASKPPIETGRAREINPRRPDAAAYIRQWLTQAEPLENAKGAELRFDKWGRLYGKAANGGIITLNSKPDHTVSNIPEVHVWAHRNKFDSLNLCKLEEYVTAKIYGTQLSGCIKGTVSESNTIPNLIGHSAKTAKKKLQDAGYRVKLRVGKTPSSPGQALTVAELQPAPGGTLAPGETVFVTVYADARKKAKVPDLIGISAKEAKIRLTAMGFMVKLQAAGPAPTKKEALTVKSMQPEAGTHLTIGEQVVLTVFVDAKESVRVPKLVGRTNLEAKKQLAGLGLKSMIKLRGPAPAAEKAFRVTKIDPVAGTKVPAGSTVTVTAWGSIKQCNITMPSVLDKSLNEALFRLQDLGFKVDAIRGEEAPYQASENKIIRQSPNAGIQIAAKSEVKIWYFGPYVWRGMLPDLAGLSLSESRQKLGENNLRIRVSSEKPPAPSAGKVGKIMAQSPKPKSKVQEGDQVTVTLYGRTKAQQVAAYSCEGLPGSESYWDGNSGSPRCKCKDGHVLRADKKGCDPKPEKKITVDDAPKKSKQHEHCSLGKSGFIYSPKRDYFVFRSNRLNQYGSRKYGIVPGYQKEVALGIQRQGNMTLLMNAPLRDLCPHLRENCSLTSMNHADRSFFGDLCGKWSEPKPLSPSKKTPAEAGNK